LFTFGCGSFGRLGHGDHKHLYLPRLVAAMKGKVVTQVSCGGWYTAVITSSGTLYTFGSNRFGQLSQGKVPVQMFPRNVSMLAGNAIVKLSCGKTHTLVYTESEECLSFGEGHCGQLGNRNKKTQFSPVFVDLPKEKLSSIQCGQLHSLALTGSGKIYMWGYISDDHLGLSESGEEYHSAPSVVDTKHITNKIVQISAGGFHSALVTDNGELYTWGFGYRGRLGFGELDSDSNNPLVPTLVEAFRGKYVSKVACGGAHTLVVVLKTSQS